MTTGPPALAGFPDIGRCRVMGVVNVTPDSFSDGGRYLDPDAAIAHGLQLRDEGADLLDVGGESTRPGAPRVSAEEEQRRILPVIRALAQAGAIVSVDTQRAQTAELAIDAGASIVNDVSGGRADPDLPKVVAAAAVPYVVMHWRAPSAEMQRHANYEDVVAEVVAELARQVDAAVAAGVDADRIVVDPGLGFAKNAGHNWTLLAHLDALHALDRPLLVGASRKSFLGTLLGSGDDPRSADERDDATTAVTVLAANAGAWGVRVHAVRGSADAVRVVARVRAVGTAR